jgi:hypothetical protein
MGHDLDLEPRRAGGPSSLLEPGRVDRPPYPHFARGWPAPGRAVRIPAAMLAARSGPDLIAGGGGRLGCDQLGIVMPLSTRSGGIFHARLDRERF